MKLILLKFYTGWCPFCTKMDKTTWVDEKVAAAAKAFACGKVNADIDAIAFETEARLIAAARLDNLMRVEGFLCAKSRRSTKPVLHATRIEFIEGV